MYLHNLRRFDRGYSEPKTFLLVVNSENKDKYNYLNR